MKRLIAAALGTSSLLCYAQGLAAAEVIDASSAEPSPRGYGTLLSLHQFSIDGLDHTMARDRNRDEEDDRDDDDDDRDEDDGGNDDDDDDRHEDDDDDDDDRDEDDGGNDDDDDDDDDDGDDDGEGPGNGDGHDDDDYDGPAHGGGWGPGGPGGPGGAVPEPSTWLTMIVGFLGIGGAMRAQMRQQRTRVSHR